MAAGVYGTKEGRHLRHQLFLEGHGVDIEVIHVEIINKQQ